MCGTACIYVRIGILEFMDAGKFEEVLERLRTRFVREGIRKNSQDTSHFKFLVF